MNLRRNLLATAVTSVLCFSQNSMATSTTSFDSTLVLNGVSRNVTFDNAQQASDAIAGGNPNTPADILQRKIQAQFNDSNGLPPGSADGLVTQAELTATNGVQIPITTIRISAGQAVIAQPKADGSIQFLTLATTDATGAPIKDGANNVTLATLLEKYSTAVTNGTADSLVTQALSVGVTQKVIDGYNSSTGRHVSGFTEVLTGLATATINKPINVDNQNVITDVTDPAKVIAAKIQQQVLVDDAAKYLAAIKASTLTPASASVVTDLKTVADNTLVQIKAAEAAATAAQTVATDVAGDPTLASAANDALTTAQSQVVTTATNFLNDSTTTKTDADVTAALTSIVTADLAKLNNTANSLTDRGAAKADLDALFTKYPSNAYLTSQSTTIQTAEHVFGNDQTIATETAILNGTTGDKAAALQALETLLTDSKLTDAQKTQIQTAGNAYVTGELAILNDSSKSVADREAAKAALDDLLSKYAANFADQATTIQTAEHVFANDKIIIADLAILNGTTAGDKAAALKELSDLLKDMTLTDAQKAEINTAESQYGVNPLVTANLAILNGNGTTAQKAAALSKLENLYLTAQRNLTSGDDLKKFQAQATLNAISDSIAKAELSNATTALGFADKAFEHTTTAGQIIAERNALMNAQAAAKRSVNFASAATQPTVAGGSPALSASDIQAKAQQQLATTSTAGYFARNMSSNGIAGNPSSMLNMTADHMFSQAADVNNLTTIASGTSASGVQHSISAGVQYNYYNLAGTNVNTVSLPLSYTTQINSKSQVIFSVPLSYISQNQNDTYQVGGGLAFKYNVTDNWTLTPAFSYSYRTVGSTNYSDYYAKRALGDGVSVAGGGVTSKYDWTYSDIKISLTNMGGYFSVADGFGATSANALGYSNDLGSMVMKNGISLGKSVNGFGVTTYLNDAEYFGSKLFFDQYNEFGFALKPENMGALNAFSINANYLFSFKGGKRGDLDGFKLNLNYKF